MTYPNLAHGQADGPISYAQSPPVGGAYSPQWQNCGIYNAPVSNEAAVHSLARGAVWVTYRPDMAISEIATLQRMARDRTYILVSPYPEQETPLVATAWGVQLPLYDPQDNRLTIFLARYRQGAQVPEAGAAMQRRHRRSKAPIRRVPAELVHVGINGRMVCHAEPQRSISWASRTRDPSLRLAASAQDDIC